jgi:hypothetical protein
MAREWKLLLRPGFYERSQSRIALYAKEHLCATVSNMAQEGPKNQKFCNSVSSTARVEEQE